jgi:pimeloyl-ACP methyl ester carboxylesterase
LTDSQPHPQTEPGTDPDGQPIPIAYITQPDPGESGAGRIAYRHRAGNSSGKPGVLFCGGFQSDMDGGKARYLDVRCAAADLQYTRFDYRGHGASDGAFADGTIGDWADDARLIFDRICTGPQVVVGSSMGGWIALLLALARPLRIAGLVLVAPAPDFPRRLMLPAMPDEAQAALARDGLWQRPSAYGPDPYPITRRLIGESEAHELLDGPPIPIGAPVHILHGSDDEDVPLGHGWRVFDRLHAPQKRMTVVPGGDHRLSTPADLDRLWAALKPMLAA